MIFAPYDLSQILLHACIEKLQGCALGLCTVGRKV
jgi:hypothetical protein